MLVDTSHFWFNYRHIANTLSFYHTVKRLGIPDSHIILMLADDMACSPATSSRARYTATTTASWTCTAITSRWTTGLRGHSRELARRAHQSSSARHASVQMLTDAGAISDLHDRTRWRRVSQISDQFEIMSKDVADALGQMREKRRYNEVLFIAETCQAATMAARFYSPNVLSVGSSAKGESSYSHHVDRDIGLSVIDRFTYHTLEFMENVHVHSPTTANQLFDHLVYHKIYPTCRSWTTFDTGRWTPCG